MSGKKSITRKVGKDKSRAGSVCSKVGNFDRCSLPKGHAGVHKNRFEEFIQWDVKRPIT